MEILQTAKGYVNIFRAILLITPFPETIPL